MRNKWTLSVIATLLLSVAITLWLVRGAEGAQVGLIDLHHGGNHATRLGERPNAGGPDGVVPGGAGDGCPLALAGKGGTDLWRDGFGCHRGRTDGGHRSERGGGCRAGGGGCASFTDRPGPLARPR